MEMENKNLLVVGLGKTGVSVIEQLKGKAVSIIAVDDSPEMDVPVKKDENVNFFLGRAAKDLGLLENIQLVVASPGVPSVHPFLKTAKDLKIPIWSEIELAWNLLEKDEKKNTIAVTGTNGKTTVVNILGKILRDKGMEACVCGNVGYPLISTLGRRGLFRVIEVSSFQLEWTVNFAPHIGILLNISSDHLDRHLALEEYARIKFKLFSKQKNSDYCIINAEDGVISSMSEGFSTGSKIVRYGEKKDLDVFFSGDKVTCSLGSKKMEIDASSSRLRGKHNISNIAACIAASALVGVDERTMEIALNEFRPLEHRLEYAGVHKGVHCYNDSKSTNPHATIAALKNFKKPLTLLLGGKDKGMDLKDLVAELEKSISSLILIGESKAKIFNTLNGAGHGFEVHVCDTLKDAVRKGLEVTPRGGTFLFSPAFASMDMFRDYKDRGRKFKSILALEDDGS